MGDQGAEAAGQLVGPGAEVAVRAGKRWPRRAAGVSPAVSVDLDPHASGRAWRRRPPGRPSIEREVQG
ncbi:MAG TPA: hypothetical protein VEK80_00580 [Kribbellaceae bacterium]|nr:hypothetical protein [Kribbellaceae bacterium]